MSTLAEPIADNRMISGRFLKSTMAYSVAGTLPMLSGFILLPFYTNQLSTNDYGLLMLYIGFSLLIQVLVSYSLEAYLGAHYVEVKDDEEKRKSLVSNVAGLLLVIGISFIAIAFLVGKPVFNVTFNRSDVLDFFPYGIMSVLTGFFNSFFRAYTYLLTFEKKPVRFFIYNLTNFVLTIVISIIGLHMYPDSLIGPMYGRLLSGLGIFLISVIGFISSGGISFRFRELKGLHVFCFPYLIYVILLWVSANVDRFIINDLLNPEYVAIFDFAVRCTLLVDFVQTGVVSAIYPEVFEIWHKTKATGTSKETNKYFHSLTGISLLVICLFMIAVPIAIPWVVKREEFYSSFLFMGVIAGSFATRGLYYYFVSILLHLKRTKRFITIFGISGAIQLPVIWICTSYWELDGAVWAALLAKVVQIIVLYFFTRNLFTIHMNVTKMIVLPAAVIIALTCIWLFMDSWNVYVYIALLLATSSALVLLYKNEFIEVWKKFRKRKNPANSKV